MNSARNNDKSACEHVTKRPSLFFLACQKKNNNKPNKNELSFSPLRSKSIQSLNALQSEITARFR